MNEQRSMHYRQRIRYLKAGGILALVILILFFLTPGEREKVEKYVGGPLINSVANLDVILIICI
jgi:hypothetical protein